MTMYLEGKVSWFGGPEDEGVAPDEGLAFIYDVDDAPHLFLPYQPEGTSGLARRLNPAVPFIACRWDYDDEEQTREMLLSNVALVRAPSTGKFFLAWPADWGPADWTERVCDISSGLMEYLGVTTDDTVEVVYPYIPTREGEV
jgi:hypothetical protein